ncbi:MAG: PEP-CTERM sorting domain-containing protein [Pseudomonadota bacterium]
MRRKVIIGSFLATVTATDTTTAVRFENTIDPTPDDFGPVLDNVDVVPVPEPSSLALLGLGSALMMQRRRA